MASLGHIALGMAAARAYRTGDLAPRIHLATSMVLWSALSFLPDADVIGFRFGIRYGDEWGHRGASHSIVFAMLAAAALAALAPLLRVGALRLFVFAAAVIASHGIVDSFTDGGLGIALLWPMDLTRYFAPWTPIPVSPIGRAFFSPRGLAVFTTELLIFAPCLVYALWPRDPPSAAEPDAADAAERERR